MRKEKSFRVDTGRMSVSITVGIFLGMMAVIMFVEGRLISAVVFFAGSVVYLREMLKNAPFVSFGVNGVSETLFGRRKRAISWDEVAEAGVIGTKVFNQKKPEKTGRMYLYFSPRILDESGRFDLMLNWPPKDMIYVLYDEERTEHLRRVWCGKIETYNVGELRL